MAGMRRRCRKCRQPLVLPGDDDQSGVATAVFAADGKDVLNDAVNDAVDRLKATENHDGTELGKTLSGKLLKEYRLNLEATGDSSTQSAIDRRRLTILKLGRSRDARAFELIEPFVSDASKVVRQAVATAVGELGDRQGVRSGLQLLCDDDTGVVREAIKSLKRLADPIVIRPLLLIGLNNPMLRVQALDAVIKTGNAALSELFDIIETRNPLTSGDAVIALGRIGDKQAVPSLLMTLEHADAGLRARIADALGRLGDRSALAKIIGLLSDSDETVQLSAVQAVQKIPDRRAVKPILTILNRTENADLRKQSVLALAATGSEKIVPTLTGLLGNADAELEKAIADALSRIDSSEAAETLATMLDANDLAVVTKALAGLRQHPVASSTPKLVQLCEHPNAGVRRHAVEALAESGQDVANDILQQRLLDDSSVEVRAAAARGCGKTNDKRFVRILEQAVRDEPSVRVAALVSLATLGDASSIPALLASLNDSVAEVRYHAVMGLGKLKADKATDAIKALLEDESEMVRLGATSALQNLGIQNANIPLSRRIAKRASDMVPDSLAGALPAGPLLATVALTITVGGLGWLFVSRSEGSIENSIALAQARPVIATHWLPDSSDVILIRSGGPADIWSGATGDFKKKIEAPDIVDCGSTSKLMTKRGRKSLISWTPEGPKPGESAVISPPSEPVEYSRDLKFATYITKDSGVALWDTVEGASLGELPFVPVPTPVLSSDGSLIAGADSAGNIVVLDRLTGKSVSEPGDAGSVASKDDGKFLKMMFSAEGNTLAVIRHDRIVISEPSETNLVVSTVKERVNSGHAKFPDKSAIYSTMGTSIVRVDLASKEVKKWLVTNRQISINGWSLSSDEKLAAVSGENKKFGWVVNLSDEQVHELSPAAWPAE